MSHAYNVSHSEVFKSHDHTKCARLQWMTGKVTKAFWFLNHLHSALFNLQAPKNWKSNSLCQWPIRICIAHALKTSWTSWRRVILIWFSKDLKAQKHVINHICFHFLPIVIWGWVVPNVRTGVYVQQRYCLSFYHCEWLRGPIKQGVRR